MSEIALGGVGFISFFCQQCFFEDLIKQEVRQLLECIEMLDPDCSTSIAVYILSTCCLCNAIHTAVKLLSSTEGTFCKHGHTAAFQKESMQMLLDRATCRNISIQHILNPLTTNDGRLRSSEAMTSLL